ncbi:MAG: 4-hydroxy-tetrahydrodipicolinate synthase [Sulfuricurvum sp. PC08-66]|nr:MAG: 4-hydroxy-tetrahydrodipicolinate synthase [Sulfuricurvum sp. PC08-66]
MSMLVGAMTALITPVRDGKVDHETYARLIRRQIAHGIDVVVPVGTTGESATLSHEEHRACIETAVAVCKGTNTKVLAGAGSNSTAEAISLAQFAQDAGADAVLAVTPYYNKPSQEGLYQHYKAIASAISIPVMLYNVPGRTAVDMSADTVIRLFDDVANIVAIKEATGSMERTVELLARRPELIVICGDDAINYPLMANGAKGTISVTGNLLPDQISQLVHKALTGDFAGAKAINDALFSINKALFCESNPVPIKAAMHHAGLIPSLEYRLPLVLPSKESFETLTQAMQHYTIKE